jgi:hypothetical protein
MRILIIIAYWIGFFIISCIPIALWVWLLINIIPNISNDELNITTILLSSGGTTIIMLLMYYLIGEPLYEKWFEFY